MPKLKSALFLISLTIAIFIVTKTPPLSNFKLQLALLGLIAFGIYAYILSKKGQSLTSHKSSVFYFITVVLLLVGATDWFYSPFFFVLYLLAIVLSFTSTLVLSLSFTITLVILFSFNIGEVDLAYDFLVVLSLLTTIPLSVYLRKEYLRLKEDKKEILVLEEEKEKYQTSVESILANKVNNFAVNLRQPVNDIRLLAERLMKIKKGEELEKNVERILISSKEALHLIKSFECETTGKELLSSPNTSSPPLPVVPD